MSRTFRSGPRTDAILCKNRFIEPIAHHQFSMDPPLPRRFGYKASTRVRIGPSIDAIRGDNRIFDDIAPH